jgi:ectoine hydroxylase-related dioxygenase (phytanoyl-CoA dioxygenase family)
MPLTAQDWYKNRPWIDEPDADIDGYCRKLARPEDYDLKAKLEYWQEHGVVIFENAIDTDLIDLLQEDLDALVANPKDHEIFVEIAGRQRPANECDAETLRNESRIKFCNVQCASLAAAHLSLSKCVTSFLGHIFQSPPCLLQSLLFHKGSQQPIHLDYPYVRTQKHLARMAASWIPLEDVHADSGPLEYFCGSQKPEIMPFFDWGGGNIVMDPDAQREPMEFSNYLTDQMKRLAIEPKVFLPKRGDVLIWHAYLAHAGTEIRNPALTRRSYVSHYAPLDAYPDLHMKPKAIEKGHCVARNGGYVFDLPWYNGKVKLPSHNALSATV